MLGLFHAIIPCLCLYAVTPFSIYRCMGYAWGYGCYYCCMLSSHSFACILKLFGYILQHFNENARGKVVINAGLNRHHIMSRTSISTPRKSIWGLLNYMLRYALISVQCTCTLYCHAKYTGSSALFNLSHYGLAWCADSANTDDLYGR